MTSPASRVAALAARSQPLRIDVGGTSLAWRHWPGPAEQPPLVLLHGGFGSWTHWVANLRSLMAYRDVWTVDIPGLGESGDLPAPQTTAHFADVLAEGFDTVLGSNAAYDLAGFSFGAMLGAHIAMRTGSRCQRFFLIGAAGCGELHHQVTLLATPDDAAPADEATAIHRENLQRLMIAQSELIDDLAIFVHADNLARHRFRSRKLAGSNDLLAVLPRIEAQLIGIWGELDATAGSATDIARRQELFQQAQPGAEFYVLPGVGHWAMYEAPEQINALLSGVSAHQS